MTSVLRSLLHPDALRVIVKQSYGLDAEECILLRSLVNDVYHVITPHRRYVLKIYRHCGWSAPEVAWELEFVTHLAATGVHVAATVPLADGQPVGELDAPEGPRPFALSDHVDGHKPQPPFDETLYRDFGRLVAQLHTAGDTFRTTRPRKPSTLQRILDEPLAATLPTLAGQPDTQSLVRDLAAAARHRIAEHAHHLDWGPCHGDVTLDNVHLTDHGLTIHDFDLARDGWRAADLTGVHATPFWDAFTTGYTQLRRLSRHDLAALPWLAVIGTIANLRFHLIDKPHFRGTESLAEGWVDRELATLRAAADDLL